MSIVKVDEDPRVLGRSGEIADVVIYGAPPILLVKYGEAETEWYNPTGDGYVPGPVGEVGPRGLTGVGARGPRGDQGPPGPKGDVGPSGASIVGPAGPRGWLGPRGPVGPAGPAGATGAAGPRGPNGAEGPRGSKGPKGDRGLRGSDGAEGVDLTSTNGEATTIVAGTPVYISDAQALRARATSQAASVVVGLTQQAADATLAVSLASTALELTADQWDAVTGQVGGLTPGATYYLGAASGSLSTAPPFASGSSVVVVGVAVSTVLMSIGISNPILL